MRAVNLLPRDETKRTKTNVPVLVGVSGAVLVSAMLAMLFLSAASKVQDRQTQLDSARAQLAVIPPPAAPDTAQQGLAAQQQARLAALSTALAKRVPWDRVLRNFSLVLPDDVWLTTMSAASPASPSAAAAAAPATGPPTQFVINGYTYSQASVARLLSRLDVLPDLSDVQLQSSTLTKSGNQKVVQFAIAANVRAGAAAS
jgi:Tfp pilus assembly protein PilN